MNKSYRSQRIFAEHLLYFLGLERSLIQTLPSRSLHSGKEIKGAYTSQEIKGWHGGIYNLLGDNNPLEIQRLCGGQAIGPHKHTKEEEMKGR